MPLRKLDKDEVVDKDASILAAFLKAQVGTAFDPVSCRYFSHLNSPLYPVKRDAESFAASISNLA